MPGKGDFSKAKYTAVISDLHLCEAEPINPRYPLWKKFKTRQFFFDEVFSDFLEHLEKKAKGEQIELVLNGDIFDFDSVLKLPHAPTYRISWLEKKRGLFPRPGKSRFKIQTILKDHEVFVSGLRNFLLKGHRAIFVIGNHDLEMHFPEVQEELLSALQLPEDKVQNVRIADWFYISNQDTLIEHGNQYDPYCVCENPIHPFSQGYNYKSMCLPFGNLACRYLMNGMGFFNPHVDANYIMSLPEYIRFFLKYVSRAQPGLILTWFFGALCTLWYSFVDRLNKPVRDPMKIEDRVNEIAFQANAEPRMVRELRELFAEPASSNPFLIASWIGHFLFLWDFF
jgi:UDP-2,3-diacylglucosamine pyrophosphatase LpxH